MPAMLRPSEQSDHQHTGQRARSLCVCGRTRTPNRAECATALTSLASRGSSWGLPVRGCSHCVVLPLFCLVKSRAVPAGRMVWWQRGAERRGLCSAGWCLRGFQGGVSWLTRCSWPWAMGTRTQKRAIRGSGLLVFYISHYSKENRFSCLLISFSRWSRHPFTAPHLLFTVTRALRSHNLCSTLRRYLLLSTCLLYFETLFLCFPLSLCLLFPDNASLIKLFLPLD